MDEKMVRRYSRELRNFAEGLPAAENDEVLGNMLLNLFDSARRMLETEGICLPERLKRGERGMSVENTGGTDRKAGCAAGKKVTAKKSGCAASKDSEQISDACTSEEKLPDEFFSPDGDFSPVAECERISELMDVLAEWIGDCRESLNDVLRLAAVRDGIRDKLEDSLKPEMFAELKRSVSSVESVIQKTDIMLGECIRAIQSDDDDIIRLDI